MLKKTMKLIITFSTTSEALKLEKVFKKENVKGKLIPVPRDISAGCGMAWMCDIDLKGRVLEIIKESKLEYGKFYELLR